MAITDFVRLFGFMLLKGILSLDPQVVAAVTVSFAAALFYSRLRKPFNVLLHLVVPVLIGLVWFAFGVFHNSETAAWAVVVVPVSFFFTFAGSLAGGLVIWATRRKSCPQTKQTRNESGLPPEVQADKGKGTCPYCKSSGVVVSGPRFWCSSCNKFFDYEVHGE